MLLRILVASVLMICIDAKLVRSQLSDDRLQKILIDGQAIASKFSDTGLANVKSEFDQVLQRQFSMSPPVRPSDPNPRKPSKNSSKPGPRKTPQEIRDEKEKLEENYKRKLEVYEKALEKFTSENDVAAKQKAKYTERFKDQTPAWIWPRADSPDSEVGSIGLLYPTYSRVMDVSDPKLGALSIKYPAVEFFNIAEDDEASFWLDNVFVITDLDHEAMAKGRHYYLDRPVEVLLPSKLNRYPQYRALTDNEILQIEAYVEAKTGKKMKSILDGDGPKLKSRIRSKNKPRT